MALVAAAICPYPMAMIPGVVDAEAQEWAQLRAACFESVRQLYVPLVPSNRPLPWDMPHLVVIVGGDDTTRTFAPEFAYGSLLSAGVAWRYGWGQDSDAPQALPLSLTVGLWLLEQSRPANTGAIVSDLAIQAVDFFASPQDCFALGRELAGRAERVAMIVVGEGSTRMAAKSRDTWGERAVRRDADVVRALELADADALGNLDSIAGLDLGASAWRVLAGAAAGQQFRGELHTTPADHPPGYFVASWTRPGRWDRHGVVDGVT